MLDDGKWRITDVSVNCKHRCPSRIEDWYYCFHHGNNNHRCGYDNCPLKYNDLIKKEVKKWKQQE